MYHYLLGTKNREEFFFPLWPGLYPPPTLKVPAINKKLTFLFCGFPDCVMPTKLLTLNLKFQTFIYM